MGPKEIKQLWIEAREESNKLVRYIHKERQIDYQFLERHPFNI